MIPLLQDFETVILADGRFPQHPIPLSCLKNAPRIICCDGAAEKLLPFGREPDGIVGDLDSLSDELKRRFAPILAHIPEQETNDLTKAVHFCTQRGWTSLTLLGATGNREDHTLGNLSLLAEYASIARVQLLTDYGVFTVAPPSATYESFPNQQVSLFSLSPEARITTQNLMYPLIDRSLTTWWQGTLNESQSESFAVRTDRGPLLIFRSYETKNKS